MNEEQTEERKPKRRRRPKPKNVRFKCGDDNCPHYTTRVQAKKTGGNCLKCGHPLSSKRKT